MAYGSDDVLAAAASNNLNRQHFRTEEYNPLRNPGHFSDAQHLEGKGIHLDSRGAGTAPGDPRRELRVDINSNAYKDSLEQYVELQDQERTVAVRQSMPGRLGPAGEPRRGPPPVNQAPFEADERYARVTRKYGHPQNERSVAQARDSSGLRRAQTQQRAEQDRSDEQTAFMRQAINNNILLKRDADIFFGSEKESAASFVRNYHEFYRG